MPPGLRRLLHCPLHQQPYPGYAPRASGGGKPAGVPCPQLAADLSCRLFGRPERPAVCASLAPSQEMCGADRDAALAYLAELERLTAPGGAAARTS